MRLTLARRTTRTTPRGGTPPRWPAVPAGLLFGGALALRASRIDVATAGSRVLLAEDLQKSVSNVRLLQQLFDACFERLDAAAPRPYRDR